MKDITDYINDTPFKNSTYRCYATGEKDATRDFYYTPHALINWYHARGATSSYSVNHIVHDIAHIIDLYQRGKKAQLLKIDFGWDLKVQPKKWSDAAITTELNVCAIQEVLVSGAFDRSYAERRYGHWKKEVRYHRANPNFLRGRGAFDNFVNSLSEKADAIGFDGYLKIWKEACKFVKQNREKNNVSVV